MTAWGYYRTSTAGQGGEGELHTLTQAGIDPANIFYDAGISGMKASRPAFDRMRAALKPGDTLTVPELSRLGRSVKNLLALIDELNAGDVGLVILNLGGMTVDTRSPMGRFFLTIMAGLSQLERDIIADRTSEALAARKVEGVTLGAPRRLTDTQAGTVATMRAAGMTPADIGAALQISPRTVYRYLGRVPA